MMVLMAVLVIVLVIIFKCERHQPNPRRARVLADRVNPVSDSVCGIAGFARIAAVRASSVGPNAGEIEEVPTNSARLRGRASLGTPRSVCVE